MPVDPHALKIYIDGSALNNPGGTGGFAGIAVYPDDWNRTDEVVFQEGYFETTNNRMELRACILPAQRGALAHAKNLPLARFADGAALGGGWRS